jgi:hypothetical protein
MSCCGMEGLEKVISNEKEVCKVIERMSIICEAENILRNSTDGFFFFSFYFFFFSFFLLIFIFIFIFMKMEKSFV